MLQHIFNINFWKCCVVGMVLNKSQQDNCCYESSMRYYIKVYVWWIFVQVSCLTTKLSCVHNTYRTFKLYRKTRHCSLEVAQADVSLLVWSLRECTYRLKWCVSAILVAHLCRVANSDIEFRKFNFIHQHNCQFVCSCVHGCL